MTYRNIGKMRQRLGLKAEDASRDAGIAKMTPEERLALICGWTLGDPGWGHTFMSWAKDVGFKISQ